MIGYLLALALSSGLWFVTVLDATPRLSPDGRFYVDAGMGRPVPGPYRLRWLAPWICGTHELRWQALTGISLVALGPLTLWYLRALELELPLVVELAGVALICGLPGLFRVNVEMPVLVDAPAFALALAASAAWLHGFSWIALVLVLVAGATKETAPVFAAAWAFHPVLLTGLIGAAWMSRRGPIPPWAKEWLGAPLYAAYKAHRGDWFKAGAMLLPWGLLGPLALMGAGWNRLTLAAGIALALGYGSMLIANDRARLFSWAAPALLPLALAILPPWLAPVVAVGHLFNPYRGA